MGQNIYTYFWKQVLQKIKNEFQQGKTTAQIDVRGLAKLGDRSSYSGYVTYKYGQLAGYTDAAPYRDLIEALKTTASIKLYLNSEFSLKVSSELILTAAYNKLTTQDLVDAYKKLVTADNNNPELYKWVLLGNQHIDLNAHDLQAMFKAIDFRNLIYMNARVVLLELAGKYPEEVRAAFKNLFDETVDLKARIVAFRTAMQDMFRRTEPRLATHQDERSVATYLTYRYPEKYSFYKNSFYAKYCRLLGLKPAGVNANYAHYLQLISELIEKYIKPDAELQQMEKKFIPANGFQDFNFTLLAQDILYRTLDVGEEEIEEDIDEGTNYWLFQGNPDTYDIVAGLRQKLIHDWTVTAHKDKIKPGDKVIIWITGANAGCYALAEITAAPDYLAQSPDANLWKGEEPSGLKAGLTITHNLVDKPLLWSAFKTVNGLEAMKVGNRGTNFTATKDEYQTILGLIQKQTTDMASHVKKEYPLNQILYGPPGTGKTFKLQQFITELGLIKAAEKNNIDYQGFVAGFSWWQLAAMALLEKKQSAVPELLEHPLIKAKLAISSIQHPPQRLWSTLQHHTVQDCPNVKGETRFGNLIFYKEPDSTWRLDNEADFRQQFPYPVAELDKLTKGDVQKEQKNFTFATCHQSLAYEDFIEGIKPSLKPSEEVEIDGEERLQYEIRKGLFYQACEKSVQLAGFPTLKDALQATKEERQQKFNKAKNENNIHVLFLDEINRCNVSAVFGEIITLIEDDKRLGAENEIADVVLPYSQTTFGVPLNLYIIGTMNTADRSVEALDTALRRRFVFEEMVPQEKLLSPYAQLQRLWSKHWQAHESDQAWNEWEKDETSYTELVSMSKVNKKYIALDNKFAYEGSIKDWDSANPIDLFDTVVTFDKKLGIDLGDMLSAINLRLMALLTKDHLIGHAWLMNVYSFTDLQNAFKNKILPLLQEYFYNNMAKIGLVLGDAFFDFENQIQVSKSTFATFRNGDEIVDDYADKIVYKLKDPNKLSIDDFKSVYE